MRRNNDKPSLFPLLSSSSSSLNYSHILFLILISFSIPACLEPDSGCLDILATNFDAAADEGCNDCCNFPVLRLAFAHNVGENALVLGENYLVDTTNNQSFSFLDYRYFLSDVQVSGPTVSLQLLDSFSVAIDDNGTPRSIFVKDNLQLIDRSVTDAAYGQFQEFGVLDSLYFSIGVNDLLNSLAPDDFPEGYPLNTEADLMYTNVDSGYVFNFLSFTRDTIDDADPADTVSLEIALDPQLVRVGLAYSDTLERATNLTISLAVDYLKWFEGINFEDDTIEEMQEKIVNNTSKAFHIIE